MSATTYHLSQNSLGSLWIKDTGSEQEFVWHGNDGSRKVLVNDHILVSQFYNGNIPLTPSAYPDYELAKKEALKKLRYETV